MCACIDVHVCVLVCGDISRKRRENGKKHIEQTPNLKSKNVFGEPNLLFFLAESLGLLG